MSAIVRSQRIPRLCSGLPVVAALVAAVLAGCAHPPASTPAGEPLRFERDTLAYPNELRHEYGYDADGEWRSWPRTPVPDYTLHCFALVRTVRQFFGHARFEPDRPVADPETYRELVRRVVAADPAGSRPQHARVRVPGYASLREFSRAHEALLKDETGTFWESYFHRGNWRMILPFTRRHQERTATELRQTLERKDPPIVHVVRFPSLAINHVVLLFDQRETEAGVEFTAYDPNDPGAPIRVVWERTTRSFRFPRTAYFPGGAVDLYRIYHRFPY